MTENKRTILVTNDDGITAPGIKALVEVAQRFGEVVVVAPDRPQSGQGHAITITSPLWLKKVDQFEGVEAYECSGTPADCVKLGKNVIFKDKKIDLCLSGINHGSNASINIIYSGTMSAAMEASLEGINSIGFSLLDFSWDADFEPAKHYAHSIIEGVLDKGMASTKLFNVNIPAMPLSELKGIKVCKQGKGVWVEDYKEGKDPRGESYYWLSGKFVDLEEHADSDIKWLKEGYVTIVPSQHDLTDYTAMDSLKWLNQG